MYFRFVDDVTVSHNGPYLSSIYVYRTQSLHPTHSRSKELIFLRNTRRNCSNDVSYFCRSMHSNTTVISQVLLARHAFDGCIVRDVMPTILFQFRRLMRDGGGGYLLRDTLYALHGTDRRRHNETLS